MKIGLLGFGVVGRGVYDLTADRDDIQVAKVVCLEDVSLPDAEVTRDFQSVLNDETIDTVVEVGMPSELKMSSNTTSVTVTARKTHINCRK